MASLITDRRKAKGMAGKRSLKFQSLQGSGWSAVATVQTSAQLSSSLGEMSLSRISWCFSEQ
jgi:hypothetical protein